MAIVLPILVGLSIVLFTYLIIKWLQILKIRKQLSWIPPAPRVPVLGSVFEFGDSASTMNDLTRLTNNPEKMCYTELGPIFNVIIRDYDFTEFVMTSTSILNKSTDYNFLLGWLGTGLLTAKGPKWKKRRRIITPAFHFSILEQFVEVFESNGKIMIERLYNEAEGKDRVDIYQYITACALDIISESAMGVNVNTQQNKNQQYVIAVKDICRIAMGRAFSVWRRFDFLFQFTNDYRKQNEHLRVLHGFTNNVIQQKIEQLKQKKNNHEEIKDELGKKRKLAFLDLLLNSTIDGQPLSQEDIREEVDTFMFEGHDTTSTAIASTLFLLANHPEIQSKVRAEQKELLGTNKDSPITYQTLQNMKYLDLVLKEALRLYPSVPMVARSLDKDIEYKGHLIPEGTFLTVFIYGINRDPDYHENPEEFRPERFINEERMPFSYIPFSAGPRNCIGQKFALLEMKSMISKIIRNFELYPTNPPHDIKYVSEAVLKAGNGVYITLKKHNW